MIFTNIGNDLGFADESGEIVNGSIVEKLDEKKDVEGEALQMTPQAQIIEIDKKQVLVIGKNQFSNIFVNTKVCLFCEDKKNKDEKIIVRGKSLSSKKFLSKGDNNKWAEIVKEITGEIGFNHFFNHKGNLVICDSCRIEYNQKTLQKKFK